VRGRHDWRSLPVTVALATLLVVFAYAHFEQWRKTGRPVGLGLVTLELVTALLFVARRRPQATSRSALAWLATGIGAFGMLAARPNAGPDNGPLVLLEAVQLLGVAVALLSLVSLGRSFGLVAANRGIKMGGPYRLVRHPAYAGYLLTYVGYVLENPSTRNLLVLFGSTFFQLVRIAEEERLLSADAVYRDYCRRVRYRLVPFLY